MIENRAEVIDIAGVLRCSKSRPAPRPAVPPATPQQLLDTGIFNADFLRTMADQHIAGTKDHSAALWSVLMFETFLRVNAGA